MALRNAAEPLIRVNLNLYEADYRRLQQMYPNNFTTFLRQLLRNHLDKISSQAAAAADILSEEINLD